MPTLPQTQAAPAASSAAANPNSGFSFHDLLSIINPLQHLPVIGTLYRAITHDTIKVPEKIAGDALYGGLWGAVSGLADAAFQKITGKDFGDTVLALFTGTHDSNTAVASNSDIKPVTVTPGVAMPTDPNVASLTASLTASLAGKGIDPDLAQRAVFAYQKSMALPNMAMASAR